MNSKDFGADRAAADKFLDSIHAAGKQGYMTTSRAADDTIKNVIVKWTA